MKTNNKTFIFLIMAFGMGLTFHSCGKPTENNSSQPEGGTKTHRVKIETVHTEKIEQVYESTGTVDAAVKNFISSAGSARIKNILVDVGDRVHRGQTLVEMEPTNYFNADTQLENLKTEYQRVSALYKSGGVSKQALDQLKTQLDVAEENTRNLKANTILKSPIDGVITMRNFDNGDLAGTQPILQVMQITPVKVRINISELFFNKVKTGMPVKLRLDVYENEIFSGKISLIAPVVDPSTRTVMCEVSIPNANQKIRPGMFGRVEINFGEKELVAVPDKAVEKQAGSNERYVFVHKAGKVYRRVITIGTRQGNNYAVLSGLKDGEQVVVAGQTKLTDEATVEVVQ